MLKNKDSYKCKSGIDRDEQREEPLEPSSSSGAKKATVNEREITDDDL